MSLNKIINWILITGSVLCIFSFPLFLAMKEILGITILWIIGFMLIGSSLFLDSIRIFLRK